MIGEPLRLTDSFSFLLGSAILPFAFLFSIMISVGVLSENERVVYVLAANPQAYLGFVRNGVLNGILITASIILLIIALLKEGPPMRFRYCLPLIVGGVVVILLGILYVRSSYFDYFDTVNFSHSWPAPSLSINVDSYILSIYVVYGFVGCLWLLAGILLSIIYPLKTLYRSFAGRSTGTSPKGLPDR